MLYWKYQLLTNEKALSEAPFPFFFLTHDGYGAELMVVADVLEMAGEAWCLKILINSLGTP